MASKKVVSCAAVTVVTTLLGCGDDPAGTGLGTGGAGATGAGGSGAGTTTTTGSMVTTTTGSSMGGSGGAFDCDPPADPGSLYELSDRRVFPPNGEVSMCQFRGDVLLIYNAAAL
jgi:hypothetical protein